jgi:hypothetical protein
MAGNEALRLDLFGWLYCASNVLLCRSRAIHLTFHWAYAVVFEALTRACV